MKRTILTLIIALATSTLCNAQQIDMIKVFGGYKYSQNKTLLTMKGLVNTMESNQQALVLIKKAQSKNIAASIIGGAGGFLVGWPLGSALSGEEPIWALAGVGAGLIAISIPFTSGAKKNAKQAVELYNSSLNTTSFNAFKPKFKIRAAGNGIGLSMSF